MNQGKPGVISNIKNYKDEDSDQDVVFMQKNSNKKSATKK